MADSGRKQPLGSLLMENQLVSAEQLQNALDEQGRSGRRLGRILVDQGAISEIALLDLLSLQLHIPFLDLSTESFNVELAHQLPETMARRLRALVIRFDGKQSLVALVDPLDLSAVDEITRKLEHDVQTAVVREAQLLEAFDRVYKRNEEISSLATELDSELSGQVFDIAQLGSEGADAQDNDAPVVRLLQTIFEDAVSARASDIHIEPEEKLIRIRQRVDGMLSETVMREARISAALVLRLKLMCGLNISEKRLPQDGRFNILVHGRSIDVRLATLPTQFGETVVMRLLDQSQQVLTLADTGMPPKILERFKRALKQPHGMLLVTGPTGSGKTTTLYGALKYLNKPELKIVTVEDPIEYRMPRLTQIQVNPKIGLDFAKVARASLRHDPDVLLVGEMRDEETVDIGLRSAMTGHLVLSTLHTNDAVSSAIRLMDMKAEPYMIAGSIYGVLAQRLVRKLCTDCSVSHALDEHEQVLVKSILESGDGESSADLQQIKRAKGCEQCNHTGFKGRIGVFEWLELDEACLEALRQGETRAFVQAARGTEFYEPIAIAAMKLALSGSISLNEALEVAGHAQL